jgi:hypothetical protein
MNKKEHINKLIEDALNSVDDIRRAEAKPYLLTRINARMSRATESAWESAGRFIARPLVVIAGFCMIIGINVLVIAANNTTASSNSTVAEQSMAPDDFSNTVATLYDIENNNEP